VLALAFAQLGQGQRDEAKQTYERSPAFAGAASRFRRRSRRPCRARGALRRRGADSARRGRRRPGGEDTDSAAAKLTSIASASCARGRNAPPSPPPTKRSKYAQDFRTRVPRCADVRRRPASGQSRPLVEALDNEYYEEARAYAKIVQGVLALKRGDARRAVISLREANSLFDTWIGQFDLGARRSRRASSHRPIPRSTPASTPAVAKRWRSSWTSSRPMRTSRRSLLLPGAHAAGG
jgi:hypothetical protein